jgi:hypothetical protein
MFLLCSTRNLIAQKWPSLSVNSYSSTLCMLIFASIFSLNHKIFSDRNKLCEFLQGQFSLSNYRHNFFGKYHLFIIVIS